jgi:hypothetical protein
MKRAKTGEARPHMKPAEAGQIANKKDIFCLS